MFDEKFDSAAASTGGRQCHWGFLFSTLRTRTVWTPVDPISMTTQVAVANSADRKLACPTRTRTYDAQAKQKVRQSKGARLLMRLSLQNEAHADTDQWGILQMHGEAGFATRSTQLLLHDRQHDTCLTPSHGVLCTRNIVKQVCKDDCQHVKKVHVFSRVLCVFLSLSLSLSFHIFLLFSF